ncbi:MAG: hypothetical protein HYU88_05455, partial [Chloroflexi bacterium]|nr:hypothetical protein [Chloroflexota bacterium]
LPATLAVFVAALLASALVADRVFERIPHVEDEHAYLFQGQVFALGRLWAPTPEEPDFFSVPFVVDHDGRRFGKYPPGHALALALGVLLEHPWLVNPLAGAAALAGVVWLGAGLFGLGPALLAGLLGLASPLFLLQSGSLLAHPTTLLAFVVFLLAWRRLERGDGLGTALLGGIALALAFLARPFTAVALAAPWALFALWRAREAPWRPRLLALALASLAGPAGLAAYQAALTGSPWQSTYTLYWPYDRPGFGPGVGVAGVHTIEQGWANVVENVDALRRWLFGWPGDLSLLPMALGLAWALLALRPTAGRPLPDAARWALLLAASGGSLVVAHVAYWTSGLMYGPRYIFEALPALLLLSGQGVWRLGALADWRRAPAAHPTSRRRRLGLALALAVTVGLVLASVLTTLPAMLAEHYAWYDASGRYLAAVRTAGLSRALVLVRERPGAWTTYGSVFPANDPLLRGPLVFARDLGSANGWLRQRYPDLPVYVLEPDGRLWPLARAP